LFAKKNISNRAFVTWCEKMHTKAQRHGRDKIKNIFTETFIQHTFHQILTHVRAKNIWSETKQPFIFTPVLSVLLIKKGRGILAR
jgi:hypothetical protein